MNFEAALRAQLEAHPPRGFYGRRLVKIVNGEPSERRTRHLAKLEEKARGLLKEHQPTVYAAATVEGPLLDWLKLELSEVDWAKVIAALIKWLPLLLAL